MLTRFFPRFQFFCSSVSDTVWLISLSILLVLVRGAYVVYVSPYGLAPDEAQYWTWLTHNDWSFLTKPPLTTWLMGLSTWLWGDSQLGVKAFGLCGQVGVAACGYGVARTVVSPPYQRSAGWLAWLLLTTSPLLAAGGLIMSPDAVLLPLWFGAAWSVVQGLKPGGAPHEGLEWWRWILVGFLIGLGGLAKYTAGLFYPLIFLWACMWKREWLVSTKAWLVIGGSGLIALAMQAPVMYWNGIHDGLGVAHVMWQTDGGGDARHGGLPSLVAFLGSQFGVVGPVVFGAMLVAWVSRVREARPYIAQAEGRAAAEGLVLTLSAPIFMAFAGLSLHGKVQANWPVLGVATGLVVVAVWGALPASTWPRHRLKRLIIWWGVGLNILLTVMLMHTPFFYQIGMLPIPMRNHPTKDMLGWPQMGPLLSLMLQRLENPVVLTTRYQTYAPIAFHSVPNMRHGLDIAYMNAENRRLNQYDLWPMPDMTNRIVVYVNEKNVIPDAVQKRFQKCEPWHQLATEEAGNLTRHLHLWLCWGARNAAVQPPSKSLWMH